jgi:hypothetical protein
VPPGPAEGICLPMDRRIVVLDPAVVAPAEQCPPGVEQGGTDGHPAFRSTCPGLFEGHGQEAIERRSGSWVRLTHRGQATAATGPPGQALAGRRR